jgi:hypothetical protein
VWIDLVGVGDILGAAPCTIVVRQRLRYCAVLRLPCIKDAAVKVLCRASLAGSLHGIYLEDGVSPPSMFRSRGRQRDANGYAR